MDKEQAIREFKRQIRELYGYDENLKFVGATQPQPLWAEVKERLGPRDFLRFANQDAVDLDQERNRVNCLCNCKRAIDAQLDRLIWQLGFFPASRKQGWNTPRKFDFVLKSGLVAPRILQRVNQLRNRLEHEFAVPSAKDVEDALDLANLFISYAEIVSGPVLNWTLSNQFTVKYDYEEMAFRFCEKGEPESLPIFVLSYGDPGFEDFYDFLAKVVPMMRREEGIDSDPRRISSISVAR